MQIINNIEIEFLQNMRLHYEDPVIYDVGANEGQFAEEVLKVFPEAHIKCFEPNPHCFPILNMKDVEVIPVGASDSQGEMNFFWDVGPDLTGALHKRNLEYKGASHGSQIMQVNVDRLDNYFPDEENKVDLLKIDTEGHELFVLKGCGKFLHPHCIKSILFELNDCALASRVFFKDFWELLTPRHYSIYLLSRDDSDALVLRQIENYTPSLEVYDSHRDFLATHWAPDLFNCIVYNGTGKII